MEFDAFVKLLRDHLPVGLVLNNPGGGTSTILSWTGNRVSYERGKSRFSIEARDLFAAYQHYSGCDVTTTQMKEHHPSLYDSQQNGHSCHCTFFFLALQRLGIVQRIWGTGRRGSPFGVTIPALPVSV